MRYPQVKRRYRKGFTLVELLVVVLIIAILMAVAMPLYLGVITDSETKVCRANMQSIASAEAAYKSADASHAFTTNLGNLLGNLGATPVCPTGGAYSAKLDGSATSAGGTAVPAGALVVICSHHGNFAPGYDSN